MNDRQAAEHYALAAARLEILGTFVGFLLVASLGVNVWLAFQLASRVCP